MWLSSIPLVPPRTLSLWLPQTWSLLVPSFIPRPIQGPLHSPVTSPTVTSSVRFPFHCEICLSSTESSVLIIISASVDHSMVILYSTDNIHLQMSTYSVCLSVSGLLHLHPFSYRHHGVIIFFYQLTNTQFYKYMTYSLSILWLKKSRLFPVPALLRIKILWKCLTKCPCGFVSFGYMPRISISGSWGRLFLSFLRSCHIHFQSGCITFQSL